MIKVKSDTVSLGLGPLSLECKGATAQGLSAAEIEVAWRAMTGVWRSFIDMAAHRAGRTKRCVVCECWTLPDVSECIHCAGAAFVPVPPQQQPAE